jgi:two-component system cell cycle response regulator
MKAALTKQDSSVSSLLPEPSIVLVDPDPGSREVMARRLRSQGYAVEATADAAAGAAIALGAPPAAVVADLWMPSISGVQLCRLLRAEPATAEVPIILRGDVDDPRSRYWAERAGAAAYISKGRMAELTRALASAVSSRSDDQAFFMQLSDEGLDIRDRIAKQLDAALFESVIAGEVRSLAKYGSFERLVDHLSQLLSQLVRYRWLAVGMSWPSARIALHRHPGHPDEAVAEARRVFRAEAAIPVLHIIDEDARLEPETLAPLVFPIAMGSTVLGEIALSPSSADAAPRETATLLELVGRELAGPLRIAALVEESERLATTDALTGLLNRRAFSGGLRIELARSSRYELPLSVLLIDIDHFKTVNDTYGHAAGDLALVEVSRAARGMLREPDVVCRWGGEEIVVLLPNTNVAGAAVAAERLRARIAAMELEYGDAKFRLTVSIGITELRGGDDLERLIERADTAMYEAKAGGRNRVVLDSRLSGPPDLASAIQH